MRKLVSAVAAAGLMVFAAQAVAADTVQTDSVQLGDRLGGSDQGSQFNGQDSTIPLLLGAAAVGVVIFFALNGDKGTARSSGSSRSIAAC